MDTGDYIRLLDLLPGEPEDDIRCDVRVVSLADGEPYEALSYVWGDYKDLREINVAGEPISVTRTLYAALQRLRNPKSKRTLWADQLCIDQWDVVQKTHQVNKMRDIYRGCSQCLLWFGDIVEDMGQFGVQDAVVALDFVQLCSGYHENLDGSKPVPASLADPQQLDGAVKAFEALTMMGNTWWRRIWTVQEAVIPRKAVIIWGPLSFPWSTIIRAAWDLCVPYRALPPLDILIKFNHLLGGFTAPVRGLELAQKGEDPLRLLQRWRYREATDPRDKVYALMGLFKSMPFPSIQSCNYNI
ncbi:heterokaryon incompatibility protein-domain-containing protein, partial [Bisporella sp. PMI_857]